MLSKKLWELQLKQLGLTINKMEVKDIEGKDLLPGDMVIYVDYNKVLKGKIKKINKSGGVQIDGITRTWTRNIFPGYSNLMIYKI